MGSLEKSDASAIQERWRKALGDERPGTRPPTADFLATHGIGFVRERRGEQAEGQE
jgi:hypothetical protein